MKSANKSNYNKTEFYGILNEQYDNYKIVDAIQSQRYDPAPRDNGPHSFISIGNNGYGFGIIT